MSPAWLLVTVKAYPAVGGGTDSDQGPPSAPVNDEYTLSSVPRGAMRSQYWVVEAHVPPCNRAAIRSQYWVEEEHSPAVASDRVASWTEVTFVGARPSPTVPSGSVSTAAVAAAAKSRAMTPSRIRRVWAHRPASILVPMSVSLLRALPVRVFICTMQLVAGDGGADRWKDAELRRVRGPSSTRELAQR